MNGKHQQHLYVYRSHESEDELCRFELELLLQGEALSKGLVIAREKVDPARSPFLLGRLDLFNGPAGWEETVRCASGLHRNAGDRFKVLCLKEGDESDYGRRRGLERELGRHIRGTADMKQPAAVYGLLPLNGSYYFGEWVQSSRDWQSRRQKPMNYSTGLPVSLARAALNIAAPRPEGMSIIDPCCGMGSVLIEGLSMGMDISGCDINPLAVRGARINLRHYGYPGELAALRDMRELAGRYDAAVIDLPYNLCSVISSEETLDMLGHLCRLAERAVIISTAPIEEAAEAAGFAVIGGCTAAKGSFERKLLLCRSLPDI